jgi:signal transduction histidine kinase
MIVNEILTFVAQVLFVSLTAVAIFDYIRRPNPRRRDFVLLCTSLGLPLGITLLERLLGTKWVLLDLAGALVLFAQPYFLFRLLQYYRPSRRWLHALILLGMVACWVILVRYIAVYPATTQVIIFGYTVVVDAYCTWVYSRGIRHSTGIFRRRLLLIAVSAGLFTLALAGNMIKPLLPALAQHISAVGLAVTAISAILYYMAFIPPLWLRHAWHFEELREFLMQTTFTNNHDISNHALNCAGDFEQLYTAANQAVDGMVSAVVQWDKTNEQWIECGATDPALIPSILQNGHTFLLSAWQQHQPLSIYIPDIQEAEQRRQMAAAGGRTWLLVPIFASGQTWGVLITILRHRSLFIDDDLILLELFAQQCAIRMENSRLITELQDYSEQLEHKVEERTKELSESESALRELNATLEQRVEQRTGELQRSNEELDRFAYIASHDLKAPLRAINHLAGWIDEDAEGALPAASKEHLSKLQARVQRMETLLDDLLAYSRVGRQHHPVEVVSIAELIHDVTETISPPPGFTVIIQGEMPVMPVERTPLETVFRNLIGNAIKHHHHVTEGYVEIRAQMQDHFVEFTVSDNGPGIAPEFHHRIFEIFQTLLPRDQVEGSGIGLAIVKKSIEGRGGTIWVESAPNEGTTFHFTWPTTAMQEQESQLLVKQS